MIRRHEIYGQIYDTNVNKQYKGPHGYYKIVTNSSGFRNESDFSLKKNKKKRILLFGDSFTAGDNISHGYRFSDLLNEKFTDIEFYNYGINGTGTDQQYLIFSNECNQIEYDLIILCVTVENIKRNLQKSREFRVNNIGNKIYPKPYFVINNNKLELEINQNIISPKKSAISKIKDKLKLIARQNMNYNPNNYFIKLFKKDNFYEYSDKNSYAWKLQKRIIYEWSIKLKKPILIMPIPLPDHYLYDINYENINKRFSELEKDTPNLKYLNLFNEYMKLSYAKRDKIHLSNFDPHISNYGNEVIYKFLSSIIKSYEF